MTAEGQIFHKNGRSVSFLSKNEIDEVFATTAQKFIYVPSLHVVLFELLKPDKSDRHGGCCEQEKNIFQFY